MSQVQYQQPVQAVSQPGVVAPAPAVQQVPVQQVQQVQEFVHWSHYNHSPKILIHIFHPRL